MQIREELILAEGLKHFGSGDEAGEGRAERCGEAARVVQRTKGRYECHHLVAVVQTPFTVGMIQRIERAKDRDVS